MTVMKTYSQNLTTINRRKYSVTDMTCHPVFWLLLLGVLLQPAWGVPGDITGEGVVDLEDLDVMMSWWLISPCDILNHCEGADITGPPKRSEEGGDSGPDGIVNLYDFALLASNWLQQDV